MYKNISEILKTFIKGDILQLPEHYTHSYLSICQDLCGLYNLSDYKTITSEDTYDDNNLADIAKAYIHISPSHAGKLYTLLSKICINHENYPKGKQLVSLLNNHFLSVIDLGSGYGTIPQSIICNNLYLNENLAKQKLPIYPYYLDFVRVDRSQKSLEIGEKILKYDNDDQIKIKDFVFVDNVQDQTFGEYINCIDPNKPYIFTASNLFKWLKEEEGCRVIEKIHSCLITTTHPIKGYLRINAHLKEDKNNIIEFIENNLNKVGSFLSKWAKKSGHNNKSDEFKPSNNNQYICIQCNDPRKEDNLLNIGFDFNFKIEINKSILKDLKNIPLDNLKILYEKAYWHQKFQYPSSKFLWKIIQGSNNNKKYLIESLHFAYQCWYSAKLIDKGKIYKYPKKNNNFRDLIFLSPIDSIVEMQIINSIGPQLENIMDKNFNIPVSLGNRLALDKNTKELKKTKTLFEYWPKQFKKRLFNTFQQVEKYKDGYTVNLDISNYYPSIPHKELIEIIKKYTDTKKHFQIHWIKDYIAIAEKDDLRGAGIPQGPPLSHLLANIYLFEKIDSKLKANGFDTNRYTRYVDDINYVAKDLKEAEKFKEWVTNSILPLGINQEKSIIIANNEYYEILSPNKKMDEISDKFSKLVFKIYFTAWGLTNKDIFKEDDDYKIYHQCLKEIGINIPWEWIKLKSNSPGFTSYLSKLYRADQHFTKNYIILKFQGLEKHTEYLKILIYSSFKGIAAKTIKEKKYIFIKSLFKEKFIENLNEIKNEIKNEIEHSLEIYNQILQSENKNNIKIEKIERYLRFLFYRFKYFCTEINKEEIEKFINKFQSINDISCIAEPLKEIQWAINNVKSIEQVDLGDYDEKNLVEVLNFLRKNSIEINSVSKISNINSDNSERLKLLILDSLNKSQVNISNDSLNKKIILENSSFSVDFPYYDSLNLSLKNHHKDLKTWIEEPYESVIKIEEDFPLIPEEMDKYYYNSNRFYIKTTIV